jgi:uncharacterized protein YwqG
MSFLSRLFGRDVPPPVSASRDVEALAQPLGVAAAHAVHCREQTPSHLGGSPLATPDLAWPSRHGTPLAFLARIDLTQLQRTLEVDWLPPTGVLLFFYDMAEQPWGFDPKDRDGWQVVYVEKPDGLAELPFPSTLDPANRLPRQFVAFNRVRSYPSCERDAVSALRFSDVERDEYCELQLGVFGDRPRHQLAGYPMPIQNDDMEVESQLASNGIDLGDSGAGVTPRALALRDGSSEWRLLFQVDSDDAADMMWGDVGTIYFWIRESDARARRFDACWLILQCH